MKLTYPDYYPDFHCLAGACPDTCCKGWQIVLDDESLRCYRSLPGALGDRIRENLITENGETRFALRNGVCALLREDGLCPIQAQVGLEALCTSCRTHPRFIEEYGASQELSLSVSCPEAARLLLDRSTPLSFLTETTPEPVTDCNELDAELYFALLRARETATALLHEARLCVNDRLVLLLRFSERVQRLLDAGQAARVGALCRELSYPASWLRPLRMGRRLRRRPAPFYPAWAVLGQMEHLTDEFRRLLDAGIREEPEAFDPDAFPRAEENLMVYFLFRYFLKAVNDGQLLPRVQSCVFHLLAVRTLYTLGEGRGLNAYIKTVSLYSREVEHSDENLRLLRQVFAHGILPRDYLYRVL